jgi:hypothetical protein
MAFRQATKALAAVLSASKAGAGPRATPACARAACFGLDECEQAPRAPPPPPAALAALVDGGAA